MPPSPVRSVDQVRAAIRRMLLVIVVALAPALFQVVAPAETAAIVRRADTLAVTEWDVLSEVNRVRRAHGLDPLRMVSPVGDVARERSASMKRLDYFGHTSPTGRDAGDLLSSRGVRYRSWGEAIGRTWRMALGAGGRWVVDWWMHSPVHRGLLLEPRFEAAGVGIARDRGRTLWTIVLVS